MEKRELVALLIFLVSRDGCLALPHCATGLSAVCDCSFPTISYITIHIKHRVCDTTEQFEEYILI